MQPPPTTRPPLAAASISRLNTDLPTTVSKKRKRDDDTPGSQQGLALTVKAVVKESSPQLATFSPVVVIARADLPLACISQTQGAADLSPGYVFEAKDVVLRILAPKQVMVARLCPNGRLYALERLRDEIYVAVLLQSWVTEDVCRSAAGGDVQNIDTSRLNPQNEKTERPHTRNGSVSSVSSTRLPTPASPKIPKNRKGALARMSIMTPRETLEAAGEPGPEIATATDSPQDTDMSIEPIIQPVIPLAVTIEDPMEQQVSGVTQIPVEYSQPGEAADEIPTHQLSPLDEVRSQYLEALYARTPLAFYAKGPLSRARGMLKDPTPALTAHELHDLYASMIISSKKMDTKYKESVPATLRQLISPTHVRDKAKKITSKRIKLGKDCLYIGEHDTLRQWWNDRAVATSEATIDVEVTRSTEELRNREAEMQLLLFLEIMILEPIVDAVTLPVTELADPDIKNESIEDQHVGEIPKPEKKRKKRNFANEMAVLIDRLCIWHTITLDDFLTSPEKTHHGSDSSMGNRSKDKLKEFCSDIVLPFYAPRLHDQAKSLCKKLGGLNISPQRPKQSRPKTATSRSATSVSKVKAAQRNKTSLQRVLSEDQEMRHASPPVSARSSISDSRPKPTFRRESSEVNGRPSSRTGMQKSASFMNREIDLEADARLQDAKKRKLDKVADQKRELAAAIEALKKPNRMGVAKTIMDEVEGRADVRMAIQITATPRKGTSHGLLPVSDAMVFQPEPENRIPSSTLRPSGASGTGPSAKKRAVLSAIYDTPSRAHERTFNPLNLPRPAVIASTPSTNRVRPDLPTETPLKGSMTRSGKPVLFTPMKRTDVSIENAFRDAPVIPEQAGKAMDRVMGGKGVPVETFDDSGLGSSASKTGHAGLREDNLYAALGWDDDVDDI